MATGGSHETKPRRSRSRELAASDVPMGAPATGSGSLAIAASPTLSDALTLLMGTQAGQDQILRTVQCSSERIERVEARLTDVDHRIEQHETRMVGMEQQMRELATRLATSSAAPSEAADTGGTRRPAGRSGAETSTYLDGTLCVGGFPAATRPEAAKAHLDRTLGILPNSVARHILFAYVKPPRGYIAYWRLGGT